MRWFSIGIIFFVKSCFAWNFIGHAVIAQIAYDNLTPQAKLHVNNLVKTFQHTYPSINSFQKMASWADDIRGDNVQAFSNWHFISLSFSTDGTKRPRYSQYNVVWAINTFEKTLKTAQQPFNKALALAFLSHFVGDIQQPLHCASRVSKQYPLGDKGGNLYPINSTFAHNLHAFWDQGAGLFVPQKNFSRQISSLTQQIETQYTQKNLAIYLRHNKPISWAHYNLKIAKNFVYTTPKNTQPSSTYTKQAQTIVKKQVALAGYRLANILNQIYT
jgi:hypothetical protein